MFTLQIIPIPHCIVIFERHGHYSYDFSYDTYFKGYNCTSYNGLDLHAFFLNIILKQTITFHTETFKRL